MANDDLSKYIRPKKTKRPRVVSVNMNDEMWEIMDVLCDQYNAGPGTILRALLYSQHKCVTQESEPVPPKCKHDGYITKVHPDTGESAPFCPACDDYIEL